MNVKLDFEIPKGYRFARIGIPLIHECFLTREDGKIHVIIASFSRSASGPNFYVIVEPIPPELIPLEAKDITPGCAFRKKHWVEEESWVYGTPCNRYVTFTDSEIFPVEYKALMNDWEIKYLGKDWQACSKPKE